MIGMERKDPFAAILLLILLLRGIDKSSADEDYLEKCCGLGESWASQQLRCESFTGPVSGVAEDEQAACLETVDICCRKAFQERGCEQGKADAKAGLSCTRADTGPRRAPIGLGDYRRDCCEGCKLGMLTGSSGKSCAFKKFSLGIPWDPAFMECCNEALTSTTRDTSSTSEITSPSTSSTTEASSDSDEFDEFTDLDSTTFKSDDLCQLMRGLLCSEICVPTPGSYYCKCHEGSTLQEDGRTCKSNVSTTQATSSTSSFETLTNLTTFSTSFLPSTWTKSIKTPAASETPKSTSITDSTKTTVKSSTVYEKLVAPLAVTKDLLTTAAAKSRSTRSASTEDNDPSSSCPSGYRYSSATITCEDINECNELTNACNQPDTICVNTLGSYECRSVNEYRQQLNESTRAVNASDDATYEGDIDECKVHHQPCGPGELCRNTVGGYDCIPSGCPRGFILVNDSCQDEDECELGIDSCSPYERCQNTNGSFTCELPRPTRPPSTTEPPQIICRKGFKPDRRTANCVDIDECIEGPGCRDHERCINFQGGYDCAPLCGLGWYFDLHSKTCQDVNECILGHHNCRQRTHYCRNTNGSFVCEILPTCSTGYRSTHNGSCVDIDECLESLHTCSRESHRYCVNLDGGYECITRLPSCPRGFEYSLLTRQCEDLDECRLGLALCKVGNVERCVNLPGGYRCERIIPDIRTMKEPACPAGYSYDPSLRNCSDIDECTEGTHNCGDKKCYNLPGRFQCAQPVVPVLKRKTTTNAAVRSTPGSENCSVGSRYDPVRGGCVDVNECEELEDACSSNEECLNTPGSFQCNCLSGFRRDELTQACVDINECQLENDCLASQRCDNTIGGYTCVRFLPCGTGYTLNAATEICEDDDECLLGTHDCANGYHCKNTIGSYRCIKDRKKNFSTTSVRPTTRRTTWPPSTTPYTTPRVTTPKFTTNKPSTIPTSTTTTTTTVKPTTTRSTTTSIPRRRITTTIKPTTTQRRTTPYTTQRTTVTSTTEEIPTVAALITTTQKPKTTITVRPKVICPRGYETGPVGQCIDIDECHRNVNMCGNLRCINTFGSFRCEPRLTCSNGLVPDPATGICTDVDECALGTHKCGPKQKCENRQGGYVCYCPLGYKLSDDHDCVDVNECEQVPPGLSICGSNGRCVNSPGSYQCVCKPGFQKDAAGISCEDINECTVNTGICQQQCHNTWGSYKCSCDYGFRLKPDNRTCQDIDECTEFKENNLCIGFCDNVPGSYVCRCPEGYRLGEDARTCQDIDECADVNVCKTGELCQNIKGGYRCNKINCPAGYIKDPQRKNRCMRESPYCPVNDKACFQLPAHYTFNYIAIISRYPIPVSTGQVELFTMRGAYNLPGSTVRFNIGFVRAQAPPHVQPATESCFALRRPFPSQAILVMTRSLYGPQDIELEFSMEIYKPTGEFAGSAVAKIFIVVTQYEF